MATARTRKTTKKEESQAKTILESVKNLKPETVINDIGNLQIGLQSTLAGVSAEISNKIEQMQQVDEAINLKKAELKDLYDIDAEATNLENIKNKTEEATQEFARQRDEREKEWEEEELEREKMWVRQEDEHQYTSTKNHREAEDTFQSRLTTKMKAESERAANLNRTWREREEELTSKENEYKELQEKVDDFDSKVKSEVSKAEAILSNRLKKDYEHQIKIIDMESNTKIALSNSQVKSMQENIIKLEEQIDDLQNQLDQSRADAKEVTNQALQSASGRQVAQALQRVVDQTSDTGRKSK